MKPAAVAIDIHGDRVMLLYPVSGGSGHTWRVVVTLEDGEEILSFRDVVASQIESPT